MKGIELKEIAVNQWAQHFLTTKGELYSMGHDKERTGCLGCGTKYYIV